jgi:oligosaccharide translocation protein RFT1
LQVVFAIALKKGVKHVASVATVVDATALCTYLFAPAATTYAQQDGPLTIPLSLIHHNLTIEDHLTHRIRTTMAPSRGGTLYLIFTQVASRALTFIGNQVLLRFLSPTLLGIAIQLEVLSTMVLYSSRESLRVALLRQPSTVQRDVKKGKIDAIDALQEQYQSSVNLAYLPIALGLIVSLISGTWYFKSADPEALKSPYYTEAFYIYGVATLLELSAEPFFVVIQQGALFPQRARAETSGAIARTACACATAFLGQQQGLLPSILPFAVGQLAYSIVLLGLYFQAANSSAQSFSFRLVPQSIQSGSDYLLSLFRKSIVSVAATMYVQSIFKVLLSEGDHIIMGFLASLADQGAFALVHNYGGLLARLIFQPIEESSRNIFGRLLPTPESQPSQTQLQSTSQSQTPTLDKSHPTSVALNHLSTTLKSYVLFSLPLLSILPPLIPIFAPIILSSAWRTPTTTSLLATYIYYIPFLAINGILDAFVTSVASMSQIRDQSIAMAGITAVYGATAWGLLSMDLGISGSQALIYAGMVNMWLRIAWSVVFVHVWLRENVGTKKAWAFWKECVPALNVVVFANTVWIALGSKYGIGADGSAAKSDFWLTSMLRGLGIALSGGDLGKIVAAVVVVGNAM